MSKGDGTFQMAVSFGAGSNPISLAADDFTGDGQPDIAVANYNTDGTVSVLRNTCVAAVVGLAILRGDSAVIVSWPVPSTGFILESTTSLSSPNWQPAVEMPMTNNGRLEVSISLEQQGRFLRLHKP